MAADFVYEDLFDLENRPGAGVRLWGKAVGLQLGRVVEVCDRHRRNHVPGADTKDDAAETEAQLHTDVYFLVLATRRVLLFHEAIAKRIPGAPRLTEAKRRFEASAPHIEDLRNFFEHLNNYLLATKERHKRLPSRVSPVIHCRWDRSNVVVRFGTDSMDVTLAAQAAIELADATAPVWDEHLQRAKEPAGEPPPDDGVRRMMVLRQSISTVIGSPDDMPEVMTGVFRGFELREMTPEEIAEAADPA